MVTKRQLSRIIDMHIREYTLDEIAKRVRVSVNTAWKYVKMFRDPRLCKLLPW
jgi:transcriptional regulator with XRE-family HTH domain